MPADILQRARNKGGAKGVKNKTRAELRQHMVAAYLKSGGIKALTAFAKEERAEFYRLFARLIPAETHNVNESTVSLTDIPLDEAKRVLAERAARSLRPELVVDNTGEDSERSRVVNE